MVPIHMTGVPQKAGLDFTHRAGLWDVAQLDDLKFKDKQFSRLWWRTEEEETNVSNWQTYIKE